MRLNDDQVQRKRSLITFLEPRSDFAAMYEVIRANLSFTQIDSRSQTIVVTSATQGEGKSVTTSNLAIASAQAGTKTLLIDADLRIPVLHRRLALSNLHGLTTVLLKTEAFETCKQSTQVPKLDVLTSGPLPPNPSEMITSNAMKEFLTQVRKCYELIILDAPPLLPLSDSQILANRCDGVIFVIGSAVVKRGQARKAKEQLKNANIHVLGVVINGTKAKKSGYYSYGK